MKPSASLLPVQLAAMIDHTALKPETGVTQIEQLCREALTYGFASVCVNSAYASSCSRLLEGSNVRTCCVVGFPLGAATTASKVFEARDAIKLGAKEIDMVLWVGGIKSGQWGWVEEDIAEVARACREGEAILKVIFECGLLTNDEKKRACEICIRAGAHFVKTSTGFGPGGATVEDVRLMSKIVKPAGLGVKAAGGIRTFTDALLMVDAGATRLGASSSVKILDEARGTANSQC
jgi:deoxyribose-phosphate aldolase